MTDVSLAGFDPFSPEIQQHPEPYYARMRREQPVLQVGEAPFFVVSRYADVAEALRQPDLFSSEFGSPSTPGGIYAEQRRDPELAAILARGYPPASTLLTADPPAHTRYRKLVGRAFTPRRVQRLVPVIERIADELIDAFAADGRVEVVSQLAVPLPVRLIGHALGVPPERQSDFKRWSDSSVAFIGASLTRERRLEVARDIVELQHFLAAELEERRREPRDDMLTDLVQARIEDPEAGEDTTPLSMPELLSMLQQILVAGNETTTKLVTESCRMFVEAPDVPARIRADRSAVPNVVEEALRLATPTQGMFRVVKRDTVLGGVSLPEGAVCVLMYASANRDDAVFERPDELRPERSNAKEHLSFGKGIHYCLGASLARAEAAVALDRIATRLPSLRFAPGNDFEYEPSFILRGLKRLNLEFDPEAPRREPGRG